MPTTTAGAHAKPFNTDIPARMDRLPWCPWHWRIVIALGITWILDGLEVTLVGAISGALCDPGSLNLRSVQVGQLGTAYLVGAVLGALFFGYLTDRLGRKKLFLVTLAVYLIATALSAFAWDFWSLAVFRFFTGAGIGGEYSAINSAIDELIPASVRGRVDIAVNGSYWIGTAAGALGTIVLLDPRILPIDVGWRLGFGIGAVLGFGILFLRRYVPESPRWLMTHGFPEEGERIVSEIEKDVAESSGQRLKKTDKTITVYPLESVGLGVIAGTMFRKYFRRSVLGLTLIVAQAFLYNAIFFTYALVLERYYQVPPHDAGLHLLPFAVGNFLGALLLGRLFDTVGRKPMIATTYAASAALLVLTGWLFNAGVLSAAGQTALWTLIFFFASAASSSAYLTVSEIFPLELRGMAIALFFALGTAIGGTFAPWLFGELIETGVRRDLFFGYLGAAALLCVAVVVVLVYGVKAERASLEDIAEPLSAAQGQARTA